MNQPNENAICVRECERERERVYRMHKNAEYS